MQLKRCCVKIKSHQLARKVINKSHTRLIYTKAQLYAWGGNQYGQLGIGSDVNKPTPERVEVLDEIQIALIAAKPAISAALSTDGRVFTWGGGKVNFC
jgi:alpha-tubulin suppressor-like RCC1 family protein